MNYDFTTLSPTDFERLVADLLSKAWGVRLESFKPGKDSGIDIRHSLGIGGDSDTIVQCRRYAPDKFSELLRSLKGEERNLAALRPGQYVIATTVALSPANKQSILDAVSPWVKSTGDILGPSELNGLLRNHPEVEAAHFKLWISSTQVLERVLHARIFAQTDASVESMRRLASKLVVHDGMNKALSMLGERHHVLIVGNPGIGKSTLARMLMCHYMRDGFEPVWVVGNVEDAWAVIHSAVGTDRHFVIVYDDFLGSLQFDSERFRKNEDISLLALIDRAQSLPNVRLILTTREYILEDARRIHGAFDEKAGQIVKFALSLAEYTDRDRAHILFNHLYFSDLPDSRLARLVEARAYAEVVKHRHFNPRIVENVSLYANSRSLSDDQFIDFFRQEFENPMKLWERPFNREISPVARHVLLVLQTLGGQADLVVLEGSVRRLNESIPPEDFRLKFKDALRQIDGNFIKTNRFPGRSRTDLYQIAEFQNPSVEEFVEAVAGDDIWLNRLVAACVTFDQVAALAELARRKPGIVGPDFWLALRTMAQTCASHLNGHLINFQQWGEKRSTRIWDIERYDTATVTWRLLTLEKEVAVEDERRHEVLSRVLTLEGWTECIRGVPSSAFEAFSVAHLQKWIAEESGWSDAQKAASEAALRKAIRLLLEEDYGWPIDVSSLVELFRAATLVSHELTDGETALAADALKEAATRCASEEVDEVQLMAFADDLKDAESLLRVDLSESIAELQRKASELSYRDSEEEPAPSDGRRYEVNAEEQNVDEIFKSLRER